MDEWLPISTISISCDGNKDTDTHPQTFIWHDFHLIETPSLVLVRWTVRVVDDTKMLLLKVFEQKKMFRFCTRKIRHENHFWLDVEKQLKPAERGVDFISCLLFSFLWWAELAISIFILDMQKCSKCFQSKSLSVLKKCLFYWPGHHHSSWYMFFGVFFAIFMTWYINFMSVNEKQMIVSFFI